MNPQPSDDGQLFVRARRRALVAWLALLLLLAASASIARLHLGAGNLVASLGIALLKSAIVAWIFMSLREARPLPRMAMAAGAAALLLLGGLSLVDFAVRHDEPARWQSPQAVPAAWAQQHRAPVAR